MINWGIIGAGNIASRFVLALELIDNASLYAVSNRTIEKAEAFKEKYNAKVAYGSFNELLQDENVDIVYIATPHMFHKEWIIKAIAAKKAVLCEKPFVISEEDMDFVIEKSKQSNVFIMEAMKTKLVPLYIELNRLIKENLVGDVTMVETSLCHESLPQDKYHYEPVQGGCLLDLGIYNTCYLVDFLSGDYTIEVLDKSFYNNGVELYVKAKLEYSNGMVGILETAFDRKKDSYATITTTRGKIHIPTLHRPTSMELTIDGVCSVIELGYDHDDFYSQVKHVCECFSNNKTTSDVVSLEKTREAIVMIERIKGAL